MRKPKTRSKPLPSVSAAVQPQQVVNAPATSAQGGIPLYIYAVALSSFCIVFGLQWDISWHGTVGRDTFFTPPHVVVHLGAVLAAASSGAQVLRNSFEVPAAARNNLIKLWGFFYSSLGALFCILGGFSMLITAPFDDWWHNAYGLDVVILSPPHVLMGMGMLAMQWGACVSISKHLNGVEKNSAPSASMQKRKKVLQVLFIITAASLLAMISLWVVEYTNKRTQRSALFYAIVTMEVLLFLPAFGRQLRLKGGMTIITAAYFLLTAVTNWVLQAIPAVPKLGPILNPVTHFQALPFPLLLFIPAMVMDLILQKQKRNDWVKATLISAVFVLLLFAVQYPFSGFLLESPGARNWFFGSDAWSYSVPPDWEYRYRFQQGEESPAPDLFTGLVLVIVLGLLASRLSLRLGKWLQAIER